MHLLTISNLYPRPDRPQAGLFNAQLFREFAALLRVQHGALSNVVVVPEWRVGRWQTIRQWASPYDGGHVTRYAPAGYVPLVGRNWSDVSYGWSLRRQLRDAVRASDAVFGAWLYPDGVVAARLARTAGRPVWLMALGSDVHHSTIARRQRCIRDACETAAGVICVSNPLADRLRAAGVAPDKLHVVPNGIDPTRFYFQDQAEARRRLRDAGALPKELLHLADSGARVVLYVGNLVPVKAPDALVSAFAMLNDGDAPPHLVMIGRGPLDASLRRQIRDLGLEGRVHLLGAQDHARVAMWMNAADCLCLCSLSEGMPNVLREALACGLPAVATAVGGCPDMLRDDPAARLVPVGDRVGLARGVGELLAARIDRAQLAARHGAWTWRDQAAAVLALITAGHA